MAGFSQTKFMKQAFEDRTESVPVPRLADWFDKDSIPVWKVRGLTSHELSKVRAVEDKEKALSQVVEAMGSDAGQINDLKKVLGTSDDTPVDILKRLEQLCLGSVEPKVDKMLAVKLAKTFTADFYILTDTVAKLTVQGMNVKKPKASGKTGA